MVLWRIATVAVLTGAFLLQAAKQWELIRGAPSWMTSFLIGDWTISYAGGFVRRGFFGWLLATVAPDASASLLVLYVVQTSLYAIMFGVAILWAVRLPSPANWAPLLLSPAFLLFNLNDFAGSHRKEIIALAALFLLAEAVRSGRLVRPALAVTTVLMVVGVLSHEANALLVAPILLLIGTAVRADLLTRRVGRTVSIALGAFAVVGFAASAIASGDVAQQRAICDDLLARGHSAALCGGSSTFLGTSVGEAVQTVLARFPDILLYALPVMFASVPFLLSPWARANRGRLLLAVLPLAPLFVVSWDWGRWIMIATVIMTVLTVVGSSREGSLPERLPFPLLVLFVNAWSFPHFNGDMAVQNIGQGRVLELSVTVLQRVLGVLG